MAVEGLNDRVPVLMLTRIILCFRGDHGCEGTE